jgi:hypothetical protein
MEPTYSVEPSPEMSSPKKVAAELFILQGGAEPLFTASVWAEPSRLLIGMWDLPVPKTPLSVPLQSVETTRVEIGVCCVPKSDVFSVGESLTPSRGPFPISRDPQTFLLHLH